MATAGVKTPAANTRKKKMNDAEIIAKLSSGYDPEMLYVECGHCGAPVLWDDGRATRLLREAGIDPLELDSSCILVTEGCPACGESREYGVRICRVAGEGGAGLPPLRGNA